MIRRAICLEQSLQPILRHFSTTSVAAKNTCLYDLHVKYGGKMVSFAGFEMPVQYGSHSIADSTVHTSTDTWYETETPRARSEVVGLEGGVDSKSKEACKHLRRFAHVANSNKGKRQLLIQSNSRIRFIESITTADAESLEPNQGTLSVFTNDKGGIRDDLIFTKTDQDFIYMVTNAGCIDKDLPYLLEKAEEFRKKGGDVEVKTLDGRGLVAVQGPEMVKVLQPETDIDLSQLYFMHSAVGTICGIPSCRVTRCGYTGEDGVEISVDPKRAADLVERLLQSKSAPAKLAGLGARDALRLEAGLCLYGSDIDENTTPIEAGLNFVVAKRRRQTKDFPGAEKIVSQIEKKDAPKKRVGLIAAPGRAPRSHLPILDPVDKCAVGFITSGCPSPCLKKNIAIAYVDAPLAKPGKQLVVDFGPKTTTVNVTKMPFVPTTYYTKKK